MTVKEGTICSLIQSFPVLLILAQNHNKCLKTPLVYKPPSPTHSPEYYEALDALFQSIYGHGHSGSHGYDSGHEYHGNSYPTAFSTDHHGFSDNGISNCQYSYGSYGHGKKWYGTGGYGTSKPCYQYVYTNGNGYHSYGTGLQGYPGYGSKKGYLYDVDGNYSTASYAPTQVYNTKNKYRIVVKKTKIGGRKRNGKETHQLLSLVEDVSKNQTETEQIDSQQTLPKPPSKTADSIKTETSNYQVHEDIEDDVPAYSYGGHLTAPGYNNGGPQQEKGCKIGCCIPLYQCQQYLKSAQRKRPGFKLQLKTSGCGTEGIHPKICCPQSIISFGVSSKMVASPTLESGINSGLKPKQNEGPIPVPQTPVYRF